MKIIIIGAGIGGLATYHAFRKYLPFATIQIYDAHPSPLQPLSDDKYNSKLQVIGGGISLGPNGQRAMAAFAPAALTYIRDRAFEYSAVKFVNQYGKVLGEFPFGSKERYGYGQLMATRAMVHEGFLVGEDREVDGNVNWSSNVLRVWEETDNEGCVCVEFVDGTVERCDLLIGADGARSQTRNALYGEEYKPYYDGLTGFGGFIPLSSFTPFTRDALIKTPKPTIAMSRIGGFGFSLLAPLNSPDTQKKLIWFSHVEIKNPLPRDTPRFDMMPLLLDRHGSWKSIYDDPGDECKTLFRQIITVACGSKEDNNWLMLPRFYTPLLPYWTSVSGLSGSRAKHGCGRIILVGDSAHAMPPEGAQGVSCAVEDCLTLALLLKHFLNKLHSETGVDILKADIPQEVMKHAILRSAEAYEAIRIPRVNKILTQAKGKADRKKQIGWVQDKIREIAVWVMSYLPESFLHDEIFGYDVKVHVANYLDVSEDSL
ncbi:hypothetical protein C8J55DRAFT_429993 [Lentinula edodes]|uniref:FAD-binding domain-containing protein n=1 Tax=Lentinula lateritia TaxID=40482 RepID=A0A9W9ABA7_9AGAR|nr:hypothetical protein C8J55DRAFT_429993 [Lentinula edodes]